MFQYLSHHWIVEVDTISMINIHRPTMSLIIGMAEVTAATRIYTITTVLLRSKFHNFNIHLILYSNKMVLFSKSILNISNNVSTVSQLKNTIIESEIILRNNSRTNETRSRSIHGNEYALSFLVIFSS